MHTYLTCVEHDFSFNVISLFINHIDLGMELSAEILCTHKHKFRISHLVDFQNDILCSWETACMKT